MLSGGFWLSHNVVNESCYVAQFVNSVVTFNKISPLNVVNSKTMIFLKTDKQKNVETSKLSNDTKYLKFSWDYPFKNLRLSSGPWM
jgi:hypothetical protein